MNKYRNKEERYFSYYIEELMEKGLVESFTYEEVKFELTPKVTFPYVKKTKLKTKTKVEDKQKTLFQPMGYTPDFIINFEPTANIIAAMPDRFKTFITSNHTMTCFVDVKPSFGRSTNSTNWTFPIKQKMMYHIHRIYVQKIVPFELFEKTFTPANVIAEEVYKRDCRHGKKGELKLKYKPVLIDEYLKSL